VSVRQQADAFPEFEKDKEEGILTLLEPFKEEQMAWQEFRDAEEKHEALTESILLKKT
jgi:hypothetical protein